MVKVNALLTMKGVKEMLLFNQRKMAELLKVTPKTLIDWEKKNPDFPVVRRKGTSPTYPVKKCLKWHYKEDWEYYWNKLIED